MKNILTGDKNVDSIILKNFTDRELFKICLSGNYGKELCNYDPFWYDRIEKRFPYFLKLKPQNTSFKNYYAYLVKITSELLRKERMEKESDVTQYSLLGIKSKYTPLNWVAKNGYLDMIKFLIDNNVEKSPFALAVASEYGHLDVVKYLVEEGIDINWNSDLAFRNASENGHLEIVKYLVKNGADIHSMFDWGIRYASENGHLEVVKFLIENGADVNAERGWALWTASMNGHLDVVKYLVENGADINRYGIPALQEAIGHGRTEVIKYLKSVL